MSNETTQALNTATRGHHPDSPSSLQASEACPAFQNEQRESQASLDGTLQHKATETRDLSILEGNEEFESAVTKAIAYEDAVIAQFNLERIPHTVLREVQLVVGSLEPAIDEQGGIHKGITSGFPDTVVLGETRAAIVDFKFGRVPVTPAKDNVQGITYALGLFEESSKLNEVEVHFFAPHQNWSAEDQRKKYVYKFLRSDVPALELRVRTIIARKHVASEQVARNDWSSARPAHNNCLWCSRKGSCHKVAALIIQANEKYHDLEVPAEIKEYRLSRPDQVAAAYRFANQLESICKAVKQRCTDAAITEDMKPDGFIVVKMAKREVKSVKSVLEIAERHGLPVDTALELLTVPITEMEKAIKATAAKGLGAAKVRAFAAELAENGATVLGKPFYFLRESKCPAEKSDGILTIS